MRGSSGIETSVLSYDGTSILAGARFKTAKLNVNMFGLSFKKQQTTKGGLFLAYIFLFRTFKKLFLL